MIETADQARQLIESATGGDPAASARFADEWPWVVALGSDDPAAREELRDLIPALLEAGDRLDGASWVALLLGVLHDEPFVAIELLSRAGIAGRMSGVVDNFQLHTLLMDALPSPRGRLGRRKPRVAPAAAANARGEGPQQLEHEIAGAWNLCTYRALDNRELAPPDAGDTTHWIWNEGTPSDIPAVDGHRVIVLGPPAYERTWTAARTFPELRAALNATPLDQQEVDRWLDRIEDERD